MTYSVTNVIKGNVAQINRTIYNGVVVVSKTSTQSLSDKSNIGIRQDNCLHFRELVVPLKHYSIALWCINVYIYL